MSIVIVDDSVLIRTQFKDVLTKAGYADVDIMSTAYQLFSILGMDGTSCPEPAGKMKKADIDLILLDIVMPEVDGIEVCKRLKDHEEYHHIPIIMITAMEEENFLSLALDAGAIEYIRKPVNEQEILARVRAVMRVKDEMDILREKQKALERITCELKESNEELAKLSQMDALTGIAGRSYFEHQYFIEWRRAIRYKNAISVLIIHVDKFKKYEEIWSIEKVEEALKRLARSLVRGVHRPADLVARQEGARFLVLLPDTDRAGAMIVGRSLMEMVKSLEIKEDDSENKDFLTISVGGGTIIPKLNMSPAQLVTSAKKVLAKVGKRGGNNVEVVYLDAKDMDQ